jgi:hypothetical protein
MIDDVVLAHNATPARSGNLAQVDVFLGSDPARGW